MSIFGRISTFRLRPGSVSHFTTSEARLLKIGDILREKRVFLDEDVQEYAKVSQDMNPLHFDSELARSYGFEGPLVHGIFVAGLFPRIISSHFPGAIYVSQNLQFRLPVYLGEEITGEVEATQIRENRGRYLAKFKTRCFKTGGLTVIDGDATAVLPSLAVE
ncbi:hypothetical protein MLD38_011645 [Melastoma candidum]|uniref:Uncharacterized protein n=1 Tax=Melastoma candidum TaxID=119954 RepID=A0ACB9R5F8_9MYRT|nr:hypothetical protein MLD38_011645 [Melastoma candidum]